ncbi:MAG: three-Cys-motif partner protein TcmP [Candidatus Portnoybacteria bacterium]|nr:three-Cys-motif partner protein TcmP [Candidatus Portnoybacteria bacterium]MDD4983009.1 three-Cys-motif partner protein TcmP [Candidatus Portnoybacteria bacterium]
MSKKDFFIDQKDSTAIKLKFYRDYIESYLIKVLMQFGVCFIGDLFSGPGRNGKEKGSPLVLVEIAHKILGSEILQKKQRGQCRIFILFNDQNSSFIDDLKKELSSEKDSNIKIFIKSESFSDAMGEDLLGDLKSKKIPAFIFLDPFNYSTVQMSKLKQLLAIPFLEVLFFCPTFHAYRFASSKNLPEKLKEFLKDFTFDGIVDYQSPYYFIESICKRLKKELETEFIRDITIDVGSSKNTLFYITKHIGGMIIMNRLFLKESLDGRCIQVKEVKKLEQSPPLFKKSQIETAQFKKRIESYQLRLLEDLKKNKKMTNKEIIFHSVVGGFLPMHAEALISKLKKENKVEYKYLLNEKKIGPYISEQNWNKELCVISYKNV